MAVPSTDRLIFREMRPDDAGELFADPQARQFYPKMAHTDAVKGWIARNLDNYRKYGFRLWALVAKNTNAFVGDCGLTCQSVGGAPRLEVGYHIARRHRRRGYALEAGRAALAWGFASTTSATICSIVALDNPASIGVASKRHVARRAIAKTRGGRRWLFETPRDKWQIKARQGC